jgi:hypothetical protein
MRRRLDKPSMLLASKSPKSDTASRLSGLLAGLTLIAFGAALCLIVIKAYDKKIDSVNDKDIVQISVKTYAAQQIKSGKQYGCLSKLYGKESAWKPEAVGNIGGTHQTYGIPQLKNKLMINLDAYTQIDYGLKYIKHRYKLDDKGYINACKAWDHWKNKGWH